MKIIRYQSAVKIFYYLMAIDGTIQAEETETLARLGQEIDPEHFAEYQDELIECCHNTVESALESGDSYDILSENIDEEFHNQTDDPELGVSSRMLVWNMLVMSMSNEDYDKEESRIIRHMVRLCEIEESVFLEMEQIIQSFVAVDNELKQLQTSSLPYSEIRPLVDELENRKTNLNKHAAQLIADELVTPVEAYEAKEDFVDRTRAAYHKKMDPILQKTGSSISSAFKKVKEKTAPASEKVKGAFGKTWSGIKGKFGSKKTDDSNSEE